MAYIPKGKVIDVALDAEFRDFLVSSIYRKWAEAYDNMKAIKQLEYDRKIYGDKLSFNLSKEQQIKNAEEEIKKFSNMLEYIKEYSPLIRGE